MSSPSGSTRPPGPSDEDRSESVVGVYETPEQRRPPLLMIILLVLVIIALLAALVIWLI